MKRVKAVHIVFFLGSAWALLACCGVTDGILGESYDSGFETISYGVETENLVVDDSCAYPVWVSEVQSVDDSCSGVLDYCIRVNCTVSNLDNEVAYGVVEGIYFGGGGIEVTKRREISVNGGSVKAVSFNFTEAELAHTDRRGSCVALRSDCIRVACDVMNTGGESTTAMVTGYYYPVGGGTLEKQQVVNLASGQTRNVAFDFEGAAGGGSGTCSAF